MRILLLSTFLLGHLLVQAQGNNILLDQNFWKNKPTLAAVKKAVVAGNNPAKLNAMKFDPLTLAINNSAPEAIISYLLEQEGNPVSKQTNHDRTYLHWASARGNAAVVELLLSKGADIQAKDSHLDPPLAFAANAGMANPAVYELYRRKGVDLKQRNKNGASYLMLGIANDSDFALTDYLLKQGLSLSDTDHDGATLFDYAARTGNITMMKALLQKGVQPTAQALVMAVRGTRRAVNGPEVFAYLIDELKLDPNARNPRGESALTAAVAAGNSAMVKLMMSYKADVQVRDNNGNHLGYYLIQSYRPPRPGMGGPAPTDEFTTILNLLTAAGLEVSATMPDGNTLLHLAAQKGSRDLYSKLSSLNIDINAKNKEEMTVLHKIALTAQDDSLLKQLLSAGADKTIETEFGETAYDLAVGNEYLRTNKVDLEFLK